MIIERLKGFWCDDLELEHRQVIVRNAIEQIERLRAENEKLHREAAIRIDQITREQEAHLRTIADYNRAAVKNEKLHKALEPFARMAADYEDWETEKITMIVLLRHLRAAAAAIRESGG
jgi:vacuolar-type H+-ATPase subunit I/STV1